MQGQSAYRLSVNWCLTPFAQRQGHRGVGKPTNPWYRFPGDLDVAPRESSTRSRRFGKPTVRTSTARSATLRSAVGKPTCSKPLAYGESVSRQTLGTVSPVTLTFRQGSQAPVDGDSVSRLSVHRLLAPLRSARQSVSRLAVSPLVTESR